MRYDEKSLFPKSILDMEAKMKAANLWRMSHAGRRLDSTMKGQRARDINPTRRVSHWNKVILKRGKKDDE